MKHLKMLGVAAFVVALMAMAGSVTASATELRCSSSMCAAETTIKAESEGKTVLDASFGFLECNLSFEGHTESTGSSSETINGKLTSLSFTGCGSDTVNVLTLGSFAIHTAEASANNNGKVTLTGLKFTVIHSGIHCIFETNETTIGTLTGSATTGGKATLDINATLPRVGGEGGANCGSSAPWTGSFRIESPATLNVDSANASGTELICSGSPCTPETTIKASSEGKTALDAPYGNVECNASLEGHTEGSSTSNGPITAFSFNNCGGDTFITIKTGTFETHTAKTIANSNGTVLSTGWRFTVIHLGVHCVYETNNTAIGTLTGSAKTSGKATLDIAATLPRVGGEGGVFCGSSAPWTGSFSIEPPNTLNVDRVSASGAELTCGASMCSAETTMKFVSEGKAVFDTAIGNIECNMSFEGLADNTVGSGLVSGLSFTNCGASTYTVLTQGTFEIRTAEASANNNGKYISTGLKFTVIHSGIHCIFETNETTIGILTGSATTGSRATLDINATLPRVGGEGGALCGASAPWTGSFSIETPSTLNID